MRAGLRPEDELCLLLCRGHLSAEEQLRARELLAEVQNWSSFLKSAYTYEVLPPLFVNLHELGMPGVPDSVLAELKSAYFRNALRNTLMSEELARVLHLLGGAGVPVIPLKGVSLAESLYGDAALRICVDIDLLTPTEYIEQVFKLLISSGYRPDYTDPRLVRLAARYGKEIILTRQDAAGTGILELHCGMFWGGPLERELLAKVWDSASPRDFHGAPAFALTPEWEFLYLAVHAARHGGPSVKWLLDLERFCRRRNVDWQKVHQKAVALGWEPAVQSSLAACVALFGTPVDVVWNLPSSAVLVHLSNPVAQVSVSEIRFSLRLLKTPARRLKYLAIHLFIPTDADPKVVPLPSWLFFLYYVLRPVRVAFKTAGWLIRAWLPRGRH